MPKNKSSDMYVNRVWQEVTESAANTLTFEQFQTGYGSLEKTAWLVNRVEYYLDVGELNKLIDSNDAITIAISKSNLISSLSLQDASVVDMIEIMLRNATSVGFEIVTQPFVRDFASLPGGGLLVLPYPLFIGVVGTSLASVLTVSCRLSFSEVPLGDKEWMEIVQQDRLLI